MGLLKINMLGTSFAIKASEDDAYLKKLLKYYTQITEQVEKNGTLSSKLQVSIMAGIMLCDELYKEKSKKAVAKSVEAQVKQKEDAEIAQIEEITQNLIEKLDSVLKNSN